MGDIVRVALAGNPNAGKTSLFNALTGAHHTVGNYPGVTVEKLEGSRERGDRTYRFIDLPGIYSLTAYSMDEVVTRDFLIEERPDIIVDVLDSTNLERNLFLCLQFQELGVPVVGALNMTDEAEAKGIKIDSEALASVLGIPMVRTVGTKGSGLEQLLDAIDRTMALRGSGPLKSIVYGDEVESRAAPLQSLIESDPDFASRFPPRWMAIKLLEKDENAALRLAGHAAETRILAMAKDAAKWIEGHYGKDSEVVISEQRYGYIRGAARESIHLAKKPNFSLTESIDRVIMNRFLAFPFFVLVLWGLFQLTFTLGAYPQAWLENFFSWLSGLASAGLAPGPFRSLVVDGAIAGVGGVFSFVPLIVLLFLFLSILEDSGYMARAAFATDKLLHGFGLHGQSVFPMMLGFGCSVPAIMAARTLKNLRDRIVTILVIPFISCGAKLPVYVLLAGAFFPQNPANMVLLVYAIGVVLSLLSALVLRKTALRGEPTPFVMELPPYRAPTLRGVLWHVWDKTLQYLRKAGTVILAAALIVWAITTFPQRELGPSERTTAAASFIQAHPGASDEELQSELSAVQAQRSMEGSIAGTIGKAISPFFAPLGFDWKVTIATITGIAAKEVIVSTISVLHHVGGGGDEEGMGLREALRADPSLNPLVAFCLMLFTLIMPPCLAALATIKSELGWKWLAFSFLFMIAVGWTLCFAVYQVGSLVA
jgi:ferrous iron transport protein B